MKSIFTITLFLCINSLSFSQLENDFERFKSLNQVEKAVSKYEYAKNPGNEIEFIFSGLFLFYKNFISSQDMPSCTFTPSCSEYAILSIKKQGLLKGVINFFDRFSRCHGLSPEDYQIDEKKQVMIDPPRNVHHELLD